MFESMLHIMKESWGIFQDLGMIEWVEWQEKWFNWAVAQEQGEADLQSEGKVHDRLHQW